MSVPLCRADLTQFILCTVVLVGSTDGDTVYSPDDFYYFKACCADPLDKLFYLGGHLKLLDVCGVAGDLDMSPPDDEYFQGKRVIGGTEDSGPTAFVANELERLVLTPEKLSLRTSAKVFAQGGRRNAVFKVVTLLLEQCLPMEMLVDDDTNGE